MSTEIEIIRTFGPRGYKPKFGITANGEVIKLYEGDLIPKSDFSTKTKDFFNDEAITLNDSDYPSFMSGQNQFRGGTDSEKILWLKSEMVKMEKIALVYVEKIKDIAKDEPDLSSIVAGALVLVGGNILKANPVVGVFVAGAGLIIKYMNSSTAKGIVEYKKEKIIKWSGILATIQNQYVAYNKELTALNNKKYAKIGLMVAIVLSLKFI